MKKYKIFSALALTLTLASVSALAAFSDIERKSQAKPGVIERRQNMAYRIHTPQVNYAGIQNPDKAAKAESEPKVILENVPSGLFDYKWVCSASSSKWRGSSVSNYNDNYNYLDVIINDQGYGSAGIQDDWIWIPATITIENAKLRFTGKASSIYDVNQNFEVLLCSDQTKESVVAKLCEYRDFMSKPNGVTTNFEKYFMDIEGSCDGPAAAGDYFLAIHVLPSDPDDEYSYSRLHFGAITLTEEKNEPELGPNGEIFEVHPSEQEFNESTVIDANNDGTTIEYSVRTSELDGTFFDWPIFYENVKATGDADEWFITKAVNITRPDLKHTVSVEAMALATVSTEAFEIAIGTSPTVEGMAKIIMDQPAVGNNGGKFNQYTANFAVAEKGTYYFGIHIKSRKDTGWRIAMRNFTVCQTEEVSKLPDICTGISIQADPKGETRATVEFTMPTIYMNESAIPDDELLTIDIVSPVETKTVTGYPGQPQSVQIATNEGGNMIELVSKNSIGQGNTARQYVVCGLDIPDNPVVTSEISEDNMSALLKWTLPTVGENGGIVDPQNVTYALYTLAQSESGYYWALMADNITDTFAEVQAPSATQNIYDIMVSAKNEKGESSGDIVSSVNMVLGKPYGLPIKDKFEGKTTMSGLNFAYPTDEYTAMWALDNPGLLGDDAVDDNATSLICISQQEGKAKGQLMLPKFSTVGSNRTRVKLTVFCYSGMAESEVYVYSREGEPYKLGCINSDAGKGWTDFVWDLPESFNNKSWLYLVCDITINHPLQYFILDEYEAYTRLENDFYVKNTRITSGELPKLGEPISFETVIENRGYVSQPFPNVMATVLDGADVIEEIELSKPEVETVGDSESVILTGKLTLNKADYANKNLNLKIEITTADGDVSNNDMTTGFSVGMPEGPIVTDLTASFNSVYNHVSLSWNDPYKDGFVETFESISHGMYGTYIGEWKNIDFDGRTPYALGNYPVPDGDRPKAFQVLDANELGINGLEAPSGARFLCAMSAEQGQSDDWFISPELESGTDVSFYISGISAGYDEVLEIMYSTTDQDADSFKLLKTLYVGDAGWQKASFTVPENAKYIALHYASNDQFGIFIDDLAYTPATPSIVITGYNLYRDDVLILDNIKVPGCLDSDAELGNTYHYNVSAIDIAGGVEKEYPLSNTAAISVSGLNSINTECSVTGTTGAINVTGFAGQTISVINTDGTKIAEIRNASYNETIASDAGVYIVTANGKSYKVIVK